MYPDNERLLYRRGHCICAALIAMSLIITFVLRICLKLENSRRNYLSPEEYQQEAAIAEPCDRVS